LVKEGAARVAYRQVKEILAKTREPQEGEIAGVIEEKAPGFIAEFDGLVDEKLRSLEG